ncbi:MAG: undecaprenyl-phosphate glucose phosphotransferase [Phycisphaerales bacterium]|nr:undecaprenyl-phosphate glucose phosphotransferase [Phycisphaerales bacterium]
MLKQRHELFVALLCIADAAVVVLACAGAWALRRVMIEHFWPVSWENWIKEPLVLFNIPLVLAALWVSGLYQPRRDRSLISEQIQIIRACIAALVALVVLLWVVGNDVIGGTEGYDPALILGQKLDAGRLQIAALAILLPLLLGIERFCFRLALRAIRRKGLNLRHVAVLGVGRLGQITCRTLERNVWTGIKVSYFISHQDHTKRTNWLGHPIKGGLADLEQVLEKHRVDAVYIALPNARASVLSTVLERLERFAIDVRIVPDVQLRFTPARMSVSELDGMPILSYRENTQYGLGGLSKRGLDIIGSLVGIILFSPIMLACAAAISLTSRGPVIFRQRRVSLGGEQFNIYKFRTMRSVEDEQPIGPASEVSSDRPTADARIEGWTDRDDPRITAVGRVLRRTSLDELPQLFNVLRGRMSLVGPRPERPELIARFREDWRGYMLRQHVKAGITGWAQVNGLRGQTSLRKRLQYDLFYIRHWSLWFDMRILVMTLFRGFLNPNAH